MSKKDRFGRPTVGIYGLLGLSRMQIRIDGLRQNDPFAGAAALNLPASVIDFINVTTGRVEHGLVKVLCWA